MTLFWVVEFCIQKSSGTSLEALRGWWFIVMFVKRSGRKEAFEMGFGWEVVLLRGRSRNQHQAGKKDFAEGSLKEVKLDDSSIMKLGWTLLFYFAGAVCARLDRWIQSCLGTACIVADALREGDLRRVIHVAWLQTTSAKHQQQQQHNSSSTQNLLRRRFSSTSRCPTFLLTASNCRKLQNKFHHSNFVRSDVLEQISRIPRNSQAHYSLKKIVETRSMASSSSSPVFLHKFLLFVQTEKMIDIIIISLDALRLHYY
jgi:hypothetical protein